MEEEKECLQKITAAELSLLIDAINVSLFVKSHIAEIVKEKNNGTPEKELKQLITEAQSDKQLVQSVQELEGAVLDDLKKWAQQLNSDTQVILDNYYDHIERNGTALKNINLSRLPPEETTLFLELDQFDKNLVDKYKAADGDCVAGFSFSSQLQLDK